MGTEYRWILVITCVGLSLKTLHNAESDHVTILLAQFLDISQSVDPNSPSSSCSEVITNKWDHDYNTSLKGTGPSHGRSKCVAITRFECLHASLLCQLQNRHQHGLNQRKNEYQKGPNLQFKSDP
jgi:hypothetical protein